MSHELTMNRITGLVEMGYAPGVDRWHGLGNEWAEDDTIDQKVIKSGMAWSVNRARVRYLNGPAERIVNDQHVLYRSDTKDPLGIVGDTYQIVQPREMLEFFEDLVGTGGFKIKTAGTLYGGKKFWATAEIGAEAAIVGDDVMQGFLLITSSCDGSTATTVKNSTICVVCDNTLRMAMDEKGQKAIKVSHRSVFDPVGVKAKLGLATGAFAETLIMARKLAKARVKDDAAAQFIKSLLVDVQGLSETRITDGKSDGYNTVMALFNGEGKGATLPGREGTLWGLVNAVTEYVDHHAPAKSAETRMDSAWWGTGDTLKTAAFDRALALVG